MTRRASRVLLAPLSSLALLGLACASSEPSGAIDLPAVSDLDRAAALLQPDVDVLPEAPEWATRARRGPGRLAYGVGVVDEGSGYRQGLAGAMREARASLIEWLTAIGARVEAPGGRVSPLPLPRDAIVFEQLAHVPRDGRWYALARIDLEEPAREARRQLAEVEERLVDLRLALVDSKRSAGQRSNEALTAVLLLDRHAQRLRQLAVYEADAEDRLPPGELQAIATRARRLLGELGVRILVEGDNELPGVREAVASTLGELHLSDSEFGAGLVEVRVREREADSRRGTLWVMEGDVRTGLGEDGASWTTPVRAIGLGEDVYMARDRAVAVLRSEVRQIVRDDLRRGRGVH